MVPLIRSHYSSHLQPENPAVIYTTLRPAHQPQLSSSMYLLSPRPAAPTTVPELMNQVLAPFSVLH